MTPTAPAASSDRARLVPGVAIWRHAGTAATATAPGRDRVVDLLRAGSLVVVVLGHILIGVVRWDGDRPTVGNLLAEVPSLKLATWALQVMPVFFAAGAISNRLSFTSARARGTSWRTWCWQRVRRLVRPVVFYLAVWIPLVLLLTRLLPDAAAPLGRLSTQLLWFLGVYLLVVATTPWQIRLARHGLPAALGLLVPIVLVDLGRFHVDEGVAVANFLLVWLFAATLGLVARDRVGRGRGELVALGLGALAANVVLVAAFPYPISMVGMPGEPISNMAPPTTVLALHAVLLIAVVGLAWPALTRLCARPRLWHAVVAAGAVAMTLYLWHLTALIGVTVLEHELGLERGDVGPSAFWLGTVAHLAVVLVATLALVAVTVPFEYRPIPWLEREGDAPPGGPAWSVLAGVGVAAAGLGFLSIAATGMGGFPFGRVTHYAALPLTPGLGLAVLAAGVLAVRAGGRRPQRRPMPSRP